MEYENKADLHPLISSVLFCAFLYFIYLARRACLSSEGREHNFAHLWVCITILTKYFSFHHTPWLNGCPNPIVPYTTRWGALDEKRQTSGRYTPLQTILFIRNLLCLYDKIAGGLITLWNGETASINLTLEQGVGPATSWQELAIERTRKPGRQIERCTGQNRKELGVFQTFQFGMVEKHSLAGSLAKKEDQMVAFQLLWSIRFSPQYLTPKSLLANRT